jgi:4-carboxymuconolactone decarboxylase
MKILPSRFQEFVKAYPECAKAYEALSVTTRMAAPFDEREAELLKLALSLGARLEGAAHSHARRAVESGATPEEVRAVALLAVTTCGFPQAMMGLSWVEDVLGKTRSRKAPKRKR